jgi:hypothetical protein
MKRSHNAPQEPSQLATPIRQQLNLYAIAAGATGFAMLAGTQAADAEIVYTAAHQVILTNQTFSLDLNHDGIADFIISNHGFCTTDICGRTLLTKPTRDRDKVEGMRSVFILKFASALSRGAKIGPSAVFSGKLLAVSGTEYGSGGQWMDANDRYLGLQFSIGNTIHYGWARLNVLANGEGKIRAQLTGYAYETVANRPILAGQTSGSEESTAPALVSPDADFSPPTREPATVGLLAMGSFGLSMWRREELD